MPPLTGQIEALKAAGATTIYREKISGVRADRPQLAKLIVALKPSDVVLVTKLDRLGRSTRELLDLDRPHRQGWRRIPLTWRPAVGHFKPAGSAPYQRAEAIKRRAAGETLASIARS
jgi:hypothetical protein